ncbi:MAG: hypothetical protein SPK79_09475, partial [Erysipelotrichaceae bacterium]|nr:hypothetical protein [Erysipelotrichaceae bacterium]
IGESQTLEALLSGNSISTNDYYNLEWSLTSNENSCISLLQNEAGKTTGKNSYITAKAGGTAVLTLSHPLCTYDLTVWVIVPEKEETDISLTQTYIEMYKSDGSTTVTAKLINGSTSDASTVTWTAPKVGGVNIVSISKSNGLTCNIIPRNVGSTTLRAQLPNGNYADCIVTVLTDAEIVLETKTVHVNPGFTETVNYTVTPENATINWIQMMNGSSSFGNVTESFEFSVNESSKTITIKGKELGSGVIYGYSANDSGTAKAQLNVVCEYNYELEFDGESGIIKMYPDDTGLLTTSNSPHNLAEIPFHVYPKSGMDLSITSSDSAIEITSYSFDSSTGTGIIYVKALTEETDGYITLTATNPDDKVNTPISRVKYINSKYDSYTINPVFDFENHSGAYSKYVSNNNNGSIGTLYLGDGESFSFYLNVAEPNAKLDNITLTFNQGNTPDTRFTNVEFLDDSAEDSVIYYNEAAKNHIYVNSSSSDSNSSNILMNPESITSDGVQYYKIKHNFDYKDYVYKILNATAPSENGITPIPNWKNRLQWCFRNKSNRNGEQDTAGLKPDYARMDFPSSSNKQAFSYGWFYACNDDEKWQWRDTNSFANTSYTQIYRIELPEENGKEYTLEEFHKIFWWWCIGTYATGDNDYCIENNMINGNLGVYTGFSNTGTWNIK